VVLQALLPMNTVLSSALALSFETTHNPRLLGQLISSLSMAFYTTCCSSYSSLSPSADTRTTSVFIHHAAGSLQGPADVLFGSE
jgi:hypothetical protein